ncbi:MAG: hypothetical protein IPN34_21380 [Planctomycetes bacterium]|nr:hypothetical protein [Planctomycetota bacterium]
MNTAEDRLDRARESRLRRKARRQGFRIDKCRARSSENPAWATFRVVDVSNNTLAASAGWCDFGLTLDEVESFLADD